MGYPVFLHKLNSKLIIHSYDITSQTFLISRQVVRRHHRLFRVDFHHLKQLWVVAVHAIHQGEIYFHIALQNLNGVTCFELCNVYETRVFGSVSVKCCLR
ncbi:hypothetical protein GQ457_02G001180 [Hibiscus cannabinus]